MTLSSVLDFSADGFTPDTPPDFPAGGVDDGPPPGPSGGDGPACEICGKDIPWSGRGRRPKRCQDHKSRTKDTAGDDTPRAPRTMAADKRLQVRLDTITGDLVEGMGELAGTIAGIAPVTAVTVAITGPGAAAAIVRIAAQYPRFLDGLEKASQAVPFLAIAKFIAAIVLAMGVDMGRLMPYGIAAEYLGVARAAQEAGWVPPDDAGYQDMPPLAQQPAKGSVPPPRFKL